MLGNGLTGPLDRPPAGGKLVVVGSVAAIVHGAPLLTTVVDIVRVRDPADVDWLWSVRGAVRGRRRADSRNIGPIASTLSGRGRAPLDQTLEERSRGKP